MVIYTKKGDKGRTSIFSPKKKRVSKDSAIVETLGCVDELNSFVGVTKTFSGKSEYETVLSYIQRDLLTIGSIVAGSKLKFAKERVDVLENYIDEWESELPELKNFVLPGGDKFASHLQYCRSLTRRAERRAVALSKHQRMNSNVLKYLNRLSDFFFVMSRLANHNARFEDDVWKV